MALISAMGPSDGCCKAFWFEPGERAIHDMDQGEAAVWAAAIAGLAGVGGTTAGAWFTARTMRQQVRAQGVVEHSHWQRQARSDAYAAFLAEWHDASRAVDAALGEVIRHRGISDAQVAVISAAREELARTRVRVSIAGPQRAAEVAWRGYDALGAAEDAVRSLAISLEDSGEAPRERFQHLDASRHEIAGIYAEFTNVATQVLGNPYGDDATSQLAERP
ncbi:hypothetical protein IPZ61_11550 [Streptomyces sioyaensis]|nr:hypothetical protein [Streptomyces sioyaensis]